MNPEVRMKFTFFLFVFQAVGNLIMGLIAYLIRDWRIIQLSFFSPIILLITYYLYVFLTNWSPLHDGRIPENVSTLQFPSRIHRLADCQEKIHRSQGRVRESGESQSSYHSCAPDYNLTDRWPEKQRRWSWNSNNAKFKVVLFAI